MKKMKSHFRLSQLTCGECWRRVPTSIFKSPEFDRVGLSFFESLVTKESNWAVVARARSPVERRQKKLHNLSGLKGPKLL